MLPMLCCINKRMNIIAEMSRLERIIIRVTSEEKERLQAEAVRRSLSMSEILRDYIKQLPKP